MSASPDDQQTLRHCVRELTALSTLSAAWSASGPKEIAEGLGGVVFRSLRLDLVYVRVNDLTGSVAFETARMPHGPIPADQVDAIGKVVEPLLKNGNFTSATEIANPLGAGTLRAVITPLGFDGDCGVLIVASPSADFPTPTDRLILGVAANQAAIVLQQRRSQDRVRRSEQELADFFDNATVGLHWVGPDGTIIRANRAELNLLGYTADEYLGHHIAEFHADVDAIEDILQRLWAGEEVRGYEARMRCRDGSIKHVLIDSSVLWEDGRFIHTRCFTRDITEQKREEEIRLRLAAIVESSEDAIISKDLNGTITSWNRGAEKLYGYAADEIIGRPISVLIAPGHEDDFPVIMERLSGGERIQQYETVRVCKDGRLVDVSLTVSPIRDAKGSIHGASKIARDITQRKRAEDALQRQTERLRLLWEAAAVLLSAEDPELMLRGLFAKIGEHVGVDVYLNFMVNDSGDALRLASCEGISAEEARRITQLEFGQAVCGAVALHRQPIVATCIQQSDDANVQLVKSFGIRAYACNPLLAGDRLLGTLSFASRRKDQFDAAEVAFLATICKYVTVAYERLRLLNELKEADRRKDNFLAMLAHELRNPLAPIRTAVKVLHLKGSDVPEARGARHTIDRQVEHLTRLIDDLLDVSRITLDKLTLRQQPVELSEVIAGAVESSRSFIEQRRHELTVTLPPEPVYVHGDLVRLAQVFLNLLNNAAKYTGPGGRIWLTVERQQHDAVVRVKDTGVGIPTDKLPHLFEMFYQVDGSLERAHDGLGIGLSLVRRLVAFHGGSVEARSEGPGKGSEFTVRLPVLVEEPRTPVLAQPGNSERSAVASCRILVVDDNRDSADMFAMFLRLRGHDVRTAYDGVEGVEAAERFRPDAVLLDIGMPRLNGEEVCRQIRSTSWGRDVMLIAVTGWDQDENRHRIVQAGFDAHLVKPVDPDAVITLLTARPRHSNFSSGAGEDVAGAAGVT
jgi:PAS domain S-box-containing protein